MSQMKTHRSAISWSCSGGTGTPLTALSLWICWKGCLCDSRFFNISCTKYTKTEQCPNWLCFITQQLNDTPEGPSGTLCCSSFLCRTLAVSSWACWMAMSSLRAISALWSQAPITPRGPGKDLSRWICQSSSCNWHTFKEKKKNTLPKSTEEDTLIQTCPHVHKDFGYKGVLCGSRQAVDVDSLMNRAASVPVLLPSEQTDSTSCTLLNFHWQRVNRGNPDLYFSKLPKQWCNYFLHKNN